MMYFVLSAKLMSARLIQIHLVQIHIASNIICLTTQGCKALAAAKDNSVNL